MLCGLTATAASPFISKVYEYRPAPGQFINTVPEWNAGMNADDMAALATDQIARQARPGVICLGAFGGYVVFGFDHPVVNVADAYDFRIYSNAMISSKDPYGGSCEPGIVWVSVDDNGNGIPDDRWYQLAGSEYHNPRTIHGFRITYHRPADDHEPLPDPDNKSITDSRYIRWTSGHPSRPEGYITKNSFHRQSYWPEWIDGETMEFEGTLLPDNAVDVSGKGSNWVLTPYGEGYVDNLPDTDDKGLKIDWAVDEEGNPVHLPMIHFIKVQSAMLQNAGWLGETSTEVCGGEDLHPDAVANITGISSHAGHTSATLAFDGNMLSVSGTQATQVCVYNSQGMPVLYAPVSEETTHLDLSALSDGIYIAVTDGSRLKIRIKKQ